MDRVLLVAVFGALGALSRYGLQLSAISLLGRPTVLGTLVVNLSGSFLIGLIMAVTREHDILPAAWRVGIVIGFLGAYTTFSTLMFDSVDFLERENAVMAFVNIGASAFLGLLVTYLGLRLGRAF